MSRQSDWDLFDNPLLLEGCGYRCRFCAVSGISVNVHGRSRFLLFLNLLSVSGLEGENSMDIEAGFHFDECSVTFRVWGHLGNSGRSKDGSVGSIGSINGEAVFAVEGEDLGGRDWVALRKDLYFSIVIWICGDGLPLELDGIMVDIVDGKVTDAEDR